MSGEQTGHCLTDLADAKPVNQPVKANGPSCIYRREKFDDGFLAPPLPSPQRIQRLAVVLFKIENIDRGADHLTIEKTL